MDKPFRIFEITEELALDLATRSINAHFHDFEELIIVTQGSMEHRFSYSSSNNC